MTSAPSTAATTLQTRRLLLRPWAESDRTEIKRILAVSGDHFRRWWPAQPEGDTPDKEFDRFLHRAVTDEAAGTGCRRLAEILNEGQPTGRIAGMFGLSQIFRAFFQSCYIGWSISLDCINQGYATEAVTGMLDLAFTLEPHGLGLHRVQANIIPSNAASLRVAGKCGFRREGLAKNYLQIAGKWEDHVMFAKVAEEHWAHEP